ncbi:MAG: hypothetical protein JJ992_11695, partial [Planctomycetes bacterium]|nr:hypothetical protein [Planctomycetota bacterium]
SESRQGRNAGGLPVSTPVDPLAFCVGPVQVRYGGSAANNRVSPKLAELIDKDARRLTSITGQIRTDYGKGIYTVDAPRCQAAAGFLAQEPEIALGDVTIRSLDAYGSVVIVPLDDRPLSESKQILIQAGTVARPAGWIARQRSVEAGGELHDGFQILRKGGEPVLVENIDARVEIANPSVHRAVALDVNGLPMDVQVAVERRGDRLLVTLPPNTLYTIVSAGNDAE